MSGPLNSAPLLLPPWLLLLLEASSPQAEGGNLPSGSASSHDEDHRLMSQLKDGDPDAFQILFEKWKRPLISFFLRSTGDFHLAEDLTLEVAMKVFRARARYQPKAKFSTWLFQIAHNCMRDKWRHKQLNFQPLATTETAEWDYHDTAKLQDESTLRIWEDWLDHAILSLPVTERTALLLTTQQHLSPTEAAEALHITPNHLSVLLNKARNHLKALRTETL